MEFLNKKQKIILIIIVIFILLFIAYYILSKANNSKYISFDTEDIQEETIEIEEDINNNKKEDMDKENNEEIIVHVTGAVINEGVVKVKNGSRILDVIEKAGGISDRADLSKINLAYAVQDGQKIYVPCIDDEDKVNTIENEAGENIVQENEKDTKSNKVNINTATQTELETLNGIGTSTALKIINYRNENGKFKKVEDIKNVPGIGESKFENIKDSISVK